MPGTLQITLMNFCLLDSLKESCSSCLVTYQTFFMKAWNVYFFPTCSLHVFVCVGVRGKWTCLQMWSEFFNRIELIPSLRNVFSHFWEKAEKQRTFSLFLLNCRLRSCRYKCGEVFDSVLFVWQDLTIPLMFAIEKQKINSLITDAWSFCRWPLRSLTRLSWMLSTWRRSTGKFRSWRCWTTPTSSSSTRWVSSFRASYLLLDFLCLLFLQVA